MYMIGQKKQKYLVPKNQVVFLKDLQANKTVYQEYGWKNVGVLFKNHLINYLVEWCKEVIDEDLDDNGAILKKHHGIRRIPDIMAMKEMEAYRPGVNVDRLVSLAALIAFVKVQQANRGYIKRIENEGPDDLEKSKNLYKLNSSAFRNLGKKNIKSLNQNIKRSAFKRLR